MKRYKLRKWVKITLLVIIVIGVLVVFNKETDRAIQECVNGGNNVAFCEKNLK